MTDLPAPLTPPDCDLRGLEWMPLYGDRLLTSDTWLLASAEGKVAALQLCWAAWKQVPAGSLPDHDRVLAQFAGYGSAVEAWAAIKDEALRGWVRCSDGRLYHRIICDLAAAAMARRVRDRDRKAKYRAARESDGTQAEQCPRLRDGDKTGTGRGQDADRTRTERGRSRRGDGDGLADRTGQDRTGNNIKDPPTPDAERAGGGSSLIKSGDDPERPPGWGGQWRGLRANGSNPRAAAEASDPRPRHVAEPTDPLWPLLKARGVELHDWRSWIEKLDRETLPTGETRLIAPDAMHASHIRANFAIPLASALGTRIVVDVAS